LYKKGIKRVWYIYKMIYTIYKISIAGEDYIGSTRDLKQRIGTHKFSCNTPSDHNYHYKLYQHIRANGGYDCCEITPIEEFDCETKRQAECREEHWRREYKSLLNMKRAYQTENERILQSRESSKKQLNTKFNCECGGNYSDLHKARHFRTKRHTEFIQSVASSE
jgi:hypothetical protein